MPKLAYRCFVDGDQLVAVAFPEDGGSAVVERRIPLSGIGLSPTGGGEHQLDLPFCTVAGSEDSTFVVRVHYDREMVSMVAESAHGGELPADEYEVSYRFTDLGVVGNRETDIEKAIDERTITISNPDKPISDETWP